MKVFYAISTHWDREWYKPFQGFRYDLVKMVDRLLEALENEELACYTFDGQTVVLEDYLEIKPQNRARLENLIKSGKLKVGPWYVMPDELSVSGESIIRNFLTGKRTAEGFGATTWKYGYLNDIFGHIAQMPQILKGFGINAAYLGRGMGSQSQNFKNFIWRAPDGSECFAYKETYAALIEELRRGSDSHEKIIEDHILNNDDGNGGVILLYANDHIKVDENMLEFEKIKNKLSEKYDIQSGPENISEVLEASREKLPVQTGELITTAETRENFVSIPGSISSYYTLKLQNDMCENLLDNKIAPLLVLAKCMNIGIDTGFYHTAEKYLLKNQPHDSICGCSIDTVHKDMAYRYSQVNSISAAVERDFEDNVSVRNDGKHFISVINTGMKKQRGIFVTDILFEQNWKNTQSDHAHYQRFCVFDILDKNGNKVPYQILDIQSNYKTVERFMLSPKNKYRVAMYGELDSFGETVFEIVPETPTYGVRTVSDGEHIAENEFIRLEISPDGSLSILDKENNRTYRNLNTFIDDGEVGNGWYSERPVACNNMVSSKGAKADIETLQRGELVTSFRVIKTMSVPKFADFHTLKRSEERENLTVSTEISLKKGSKTIEFKTTIDNNVCDHRLRVEFPTGIEGDDYYASQAFTFVNRHRAITPEGANYREAESYGKNTSGIVCVKDNAGGLSFIGKAGIHECEVSKNGVITATMFRSFGHAMYDVACVNEHAEILGKLTFNYALSTETDFSKLNDIKTSVFEVFKNVDVAEDKAPSSFFELVGNVNVSTVKVSENGKGFIVRLYNVNDTAEKCALLIKREIKQAEIVNLAEDYQRGIDFSDGKIALELAPNKIETVYIEL